LFITGKEGQLSGGENVQWNPKNLFRGLFSFFLFYIENNNKRRQRGEKHNAIFLKTIFHRKSSHLLCPRMGRTDFL
jgi:hypothetical protein